MEQYPHIFSPGRIGPLETKNRIKYAATETNFPFGDGFVSDREVAYMEAQAKGGAGIVTTQGAYPDKKGEGKGFKGMMAIWDDRFIPGLARIADVIKKNGALSCIQILHCGREGGVELDYCLMASVVPQKLSYFKPPREMTKEEIRASLKDHIDAAKRAKAAGFDMIEISGIVGYLLSTFISRYTNKRQDEYGGDIRNRCRLMVEVLQGVKAATGNMPVGIRLCGHELLDDRGGNTLEESIESFRIAEEAGADYVSVTIGWHESSQSVITRDVPMGFWLPVAEKVNKNVAIPVMMAFRQFTPDIPERAIAGNVIDFWEMCRPMIADPELPRKVAERRENEIVPCIACNLCFSRLYYHQPIMCSVRPTAGHEREPEWGYYGFQMAPKRKKVAIIGGGPSGLQCGVIAAKRGHEVVIFEKNDVPGGNIRLASKVDKGAVELLRPIMTLEAECRKLGITIRYGEECTPETIRKGSYDAAVIATGATVRQYPLIENGSFLVPSDIMAKGHRPGKKVAIIGGGGAGLGVAIFLLRQEDYMVTIIEEGGRLGRDVNPFYLWQYVRLMKEKKTVFLMNTEVERIGKGMLHLNGAKVQNIEADSIVVAVMEADRQWEDQTLAREVYVIGDAKRPRRFNNAIHDGYRLGMVL